jgi:hypothetical protein
MLQMLRQQQLWQWHLKEAKKFALFLFLSYHTYIRKHVSHDDTSQRRKDETRECHWNKFSPSHDCALAKLSIPPENGYRFSHSTHNILFRIENVI